MTVFSTPILTQSWRVIVIDDSLDDRSEVRRLLLNGSERRYRFVEAETGASGVRIILDEADGPPDCVVLDYHLPDMDAVDVLEALAGADGLTVCPVVVLTGTVGYDQTRAVLRAGAQDYLGKGWMTPESLTRAVENATERWAMARELRDRDASLRETNQQLQMSLNIGRAVAFKWHIPTNEVRRLHGLASCFDATTDKPETFEKILGRVHPDDRGSFESQVRQAIERPGQEYTNEYRVVRPDGSVQWLSDIGRVEFTADEKPLQLVGLAIDITDRKEAEENLRANEHRLRLTLEAAATGLWDWDVATNVVTWSAECYLIHGLKEGEFDGTAAGFDRLLHPDDRSRVWATVQAAVDGRTKYECEFRIIRPDEEVRWVANTGRAVYDHGRPVKMVGTITDITDRKRAEELLRASEEFNRSLMDGSADCVKVLDMDGRLQHINAPGLCLMEIDDFGPLCGQAWSALWPVEVHEEVSRAVATACGGTNYSFQAFCPTAKGTPRWWDVSVSPVRHAADGTVVRLLSVSRDITTRKETENLLRQSESRVQVALKNSHIMVYTTDHELRYTWIQNPHPAFDPADILGHRDDELLSPEKVEPLIRLKREVLESGVGKRSEFAVELDEILHHYDLTVEPLLGAGGKVEGVTVAAMDVTDRKREESALKVSETRYRRLFESAKDGILILDAHAATITHANPFMVELLGYSTDEFVGKELWQIGLFQDAETSKAAMQELQEKGFIRYEDLPLETKAGRLINVEFVSNVYHEDGDAVIQCNIRDIVDRKRLEESLRQHAIELSEADRRKDEFLATLAHELRNPLAPIRNGLEILAMISHDDESFGQIRTMMQRQINQMVHLVDDLLDISRVSQGKLVLRKELIELTDVLKNAVETSRPLIEASGHELTVVVPSDPVFFDGDATRLGQVFSNLLNNAAKYSNAGGRIRLTAGVLNNDVVVSVKDTGIGIAADMLPKIFDMFTQVDRSLEKSQGGLGIGLSLVKRLVELHGGRVEGISQGKNKGSEFIVRLPILARQESAQRNVADIETPLRKWRMLIVDDNHDSAQSLAMMLQLKGHETQTVHDGLAALNAAEQFRPEMILLDLGLPNMNGFDICQRIREQPWSAGMIVTAVTGWGQDEDRRRSSAAGFDYHLVKPVELSSLDNLLIAIGNPTLPQLPTGKNGPLRVLVVDDMRDARLMLSTLLKASGHEVQTASDGPTALTVALDFQPNAVLMDNSMPGMTGLEVAKQMRLEPKLRDAILIALTGHDDEADRQRSLEAGFDHHLVKPANINVIRELLGSIR